MTMKLTYRNDTEEKAFGDALEALVMEFGIDKVSLKLPRLWQQFKESFGFETLGILKYDFCTFDTFEIYVEGTSIKHVTTLVEEKCR